MIQSCAVEVIAYPRVWFDLLLPVRGWQWRMRGATPLSQLLRGFTQVAAVRFMSPHGLECLIGIVDHNGVDSELYRLGDSIPEGTVVPSQ